MASKKDNTRNFIIEKSYEVFAGKGFNAVTMKDICQATDLSRGGLYSHFSSTGEVFRAVVESLGDRSAKKELEKINEGVSAKEVFLKGLSIMEEEMLQAGEGLSLALYEYTATVKSEDFQAFEDEGRALWQEVIRRGIESGEFNPVDPEEMVNMLTYVYKGVMAWGRVLTIDAHTVRGMLENIRRQVLRG